MIARLIARVHSPCDLFSVNSAQTMPSQRIFSVNPGKSAQIQRKSNFQRKSQRKFSLHAFVLRSSAYAIRLQDAVLAHLVQDIVGLILVKPTQLLGFLICNRQLMLQIFKNPILCLNLADRLVLHIGHIGFHRFVDLEGQHIGLAVEFQKPLVPESVQNLVGIVFGFLNRLCRLFQGDFLVLPEIVQNHQLRQREHLGPLILRLCDETHEVLVLHRAAKGQPDRVGRAGILRVGLALGEHHRRV